MVSDRHIKNEFYAIILDYLWSVRKKNTNASVTIKVRAPMTMHYLDEKAPTTDWLTIMINDPKIEMKLRLDNDASIWLDNAER